MLFTKLKLNYFGRFQNREIELKPGINLIYGENEAGKSTIHTFIRGMLFGIDRLRGRGSATKEDLYTRYLPWDYPGAYSGSMDFQIDEKQYRLQRSFHTTDKNFTLLDLSTGREIKLKEGLISEIVPGLTESTFKNTISIEQLKAQTDIELAAQVRNYITNLSLAKSKEIDVAKAVCILTEQRKQLEPSQNLAALKEIQAQIEEGLLNEERIDSLTLLLREIQKEEQLIAVQKEAVFSGADKEATNRMEQLPAILEKYSSYQQLVKQEHSLEAQIKELQVKISHIEQEQFSSTALKEDISEIQKLQSELLEQEKHAMERLREKEELSKAGRRNMLISILPFCMIGILIAIIPLEDFIRLLLFAGLPVSGVICFVALSRQHIKKQRIFRTKVATLEAQRVKAQAGIDNTLHKHAASRIEELMSKQEEAFRSLYTLEHAKEQQKELEKRRTELEDNRDSVYDIIMKYIQYFIPEEELTNTSMQKLQEIITQKRQDTADEGLEINRFYESCKLRLEKLKWEIAALEGNEEELLKNKERYNELEQKQKENAVELDAVKLALVAIQELGADIHDSFGQQLNHAVSEVISEVTKQKYSDIKIDEKLDIKVGWNGSYVLLERLSAGTIDQVYFALRLAVADLLLGKDEIPLLLDDSFALYDENRVKSALGKLNARKQVILFTCHKREQLLLNELGLPYHLVDLSFGG